MNGQDDWSQRLGRLDFQTVIDSCSGEVTSLTTRERWDWLQKWREVYATGLHSATGHWKLYQYEWHVFTYKYAQALSGHRAVVEYLLQQPHEFLVVPEAQRLEALKISGGKLPDLRSVMDDFYVWPIDLEWTMAFTHEELIGLGPYFSRREWIVEHPQRRIPRRS